MADTSLINLWLLEAEAEAGSVAADQITWLKEQRRTYAQSVKDGDWEVRSTSDQGGSGSAARGVSDRANHDAIVAALEKLGAIDVGARPGILHAQFQPSIG